MQAQYERDRAARKARKAALAPVELAYEIDNTDAEQVSMAEHLMSLATVLRGWRKSS